MLYKFQSCKITNKKSSCLVKMLNNLLIKIVIKEKNKDIKLS